MVQSLVTPPSTHGWFLEMFSIDIRSLALLRIGIAIYLLYFVGEYFADAETFLTNNGVLPGDLSRELLSVQPNGYWSIYWIRDSIAWCQLLMGCQLVCGLFLLVGFHTRLSTFACLLLFWSLEVRNPLVDGYGIYLLRMMMVWSVFLPLGRVWSIDSTQTGSYDQKRVVWQVCNVGTFALIVQVLIGLILFSYSIFRNHFSVVDWFQIDIGLTALGSQLLTWPVFVGWIGWILFVASTVAPVTMFIPKYSEFFRGIWLAVFWLSNLLALVFISNWFYPPVAIISWVIFIPGHFWNDWFGEPLSFDYQKSSQSKGTRQVHRALQYAITVLLTIAIGSSLIQWRMISLGEWGNRTVTQVSQFLMVSPRWGFDPSVYRNDDVELIRPWFAYRGTTVGGRTVDLLNYDNSRTGQKPNSVSGTFPNERWRRFHQRLWEEETAGAERDQIALLLLEKLVKKWDASPLVENGRLKSAQLLCVEERVVQGTIVDTKEEVWAEH